MPARSNIDAIDFPRPVLGGISLIDVVGDERRYVYRLVGTRCVDFIGQNPTGRSAVEVPLGSSSAAAFANLNRVVASRGPHLETTPFVSANFHYETTELMLLPLSDDGQNVNKILAFSAYRDIRKYADSVGL